MKRKLLAVGVVLACSYAVPALAAFDDLEKSWASFYSTGLETSKAMSVENLTLQKDAMTFVLKKGVLVPIQPIEGEITGAMFLGEGTATLVPPTPMDAWCLRLLPLGMQASRLCKITSARGRRRSEPAACSLISSASSSMCGRPF